MIKSASRDLRILGGINIRVLENQHFRTVIVRLRSPHTEEEYRRLVALLDSMIDDVGDRSY